MGLAKGDSRAAPGRPAIVAAAMAAFLALLLAASFGANRTDSAEAKPKPKPPRPNVVVIETDDQDQDSMRVMPRTRQLIGDAGTTFPNSFVNYSLCCPSRSTLLTGQYAHNHGVLDNKPPLGGFDKLDSTNTLPVWLQGDGYYTGLIGKYLNDYEIHRDDPGGPLIPPGYSEWHGSTRTYFFYGYELNEGGTLITYGSRQENPDNPADPASYSTDVYTDKAVDFVYRRAPLSQPFFLWLSFLAPHAGGPDAKVTDPPYRCQDTAKPAIRHLNAFANEPLPQPPSFNEADVSDKPSGIQNKPLLDATDIADEIRNYRCRLESLLAEDEGVERVIDALAGSGELDNTLVVFTSDNGWMQGEHRVKQGKIVLYEESIRVPLLIRGPGFPAGRTVRDMAINADLAKTIVKATGADPALRMDGRALQAFASTPGRERGRELLIETDTYAGVRTKRYLYAEYFAGPSVGQKEFYDLDKDPYELQSLAGNPAYAGVEAALARRLARLRSCSGDSCRLSPHLKLKLGRRIGAGGCALPPVRAIVAGADRSKTVLAEFYVNGKRVRIDRKRPFKRKLPIRKLKRKRTSKARVRASLADGRRMTIERRIRACR